jgi:hypothetical protein
VVGRHVEKRGFDALEAMDMCGGMRARLGSDVEMEMDGTRSDDLPLRSDEHRHLKLPTVSSERRRLDPSVKSSLKHEDLRHLSSHARRN